MAPKAALRQFFSKNTWLGKAVGLTLGYILAKSVGAFLGILIGNFFDHILAKYFSQAHWHFHNETNPTVQRIFLKATFSILGFIAKADGRVSRQDINTAKTLMQELKLNRSQKLAAQDYFKTGKSLGFKLQTELNAIQYALSNNDELKKSFVDIQYQAAQASGLSFKKQQILNIILNNMSFASLHQQARFYQDFNPHKQKSKIDTLHQQLDQAYAILNIRPDATHAEVKHAYRRLMSRNHPDKLAAQGLPITAMKNANEKTQAISKAYQQICRAQGW